MISLVEKSQTTWNLFESSPGTASQKVVEVNKMDKAK